MTEPLEAGREMDAKVAEKVFGWKHDAPGSIWWHDGRRLREVPDYSTLIVAAWIVVDRLFELRWQVEIWCEAPNTLGIPKWHVMLKPFGAPLKWKTVGSTAPEAICRAALRAVQVEDLPMQRLPIGEPGQFIKVKP